MSSASSPYLFSFERAHTEPLAFIPLGVRYYLDRCGLRLSLAQWQGLPEADRIELASVEPAPEAVRAEAFAATLDACITRASSGPLEHQAAEEADALAPDGVPESVIAQAAQHDMTGPSAAAWARLTVGQRYALTKLARKARRSDDFAAALTEFGLRNA